MHKKTNNWGIVIVGTVAVGAAIVVSPLPMIVLDALLAINLILSLFILLSAVNTKKATDFSSLPIMLITVTVFSQAINVASTRLILTKGAAFDSKMIHFFSFFAADTDGTTGLVVGFIILIAVIFAQVVLITKVAARKLMGTITEEEAIARNIIIQKEADFLREMGGAGKFIVGNVKNGIFLTMVNIVGGTIVGSKLHGETIEKAIRIYIPFAIGDGLIFLLSAFLLSTTVGIIVRRSISSRSVSRECIL
ncbi:hypothetical protein FACS1894142_3440 [Spirochaetia bacterium]|nr:hypothetical protein FACS1894142_3440 [Spirochaetia bacterium]